MRAFPAIFVFLLALTANAQPGSAEGDLTGTRPNAGGEPEEITVSLGLLDIAEINDRDQLFTVDAYVEIAWRDPRLAVDGDSETDLRIFPLDEVWNPRLTIINNRGLDFLLQIECGKLK